MKSKRQMSCQFCDKNTCDCLVKLKFLIKSVKTCGECNVTYIGHHECKYFCSGGHCMGAEVYVKGEVCGTCSYYGVCEEE